MDLYLAVFYIFISQISLLSAGKVKWTLWYNTDEPSNGDDVETLTSIQRINMDVCRGREPEAVECRVVGREVDTFMNRGIWSGNILDIPCNKVGVACYHHDQRLGKPCVDFEIRFLCSEEEKDTLSNNGGFIALAAGFSVIIPLVCVLIIRLKKAKTSLADARVPPEIPTQPQTFDPPPSYTQLFGTNTSIGQLSHSTEALLNSGSPLDQTYSNISQSNTGLESISGNSVSDVSIENRLDYSYQQNLSSRHPGMHISVADLMSECYMQSETTPPPSYDEALQILKSSPTKTW